MESKEGYLIDYISGIEVRATPEEENAVQVFSKILVEDFGYPKEQIRTRPQFRVKARPSDLKKEFPVDIAVFDTTEQTDEHLYMIVECKRPNRKDGRKQLELYMQMSSSAKIGVWYNGSEKLCLLKTFENGNLKFAEIPNIPKLGERVEDIGLYKRCDLKPTHNLKPIFRDIRNYFAATNVGATLDEIFAQQFINLLFCKIYDERFTKQHDTTTFRAGVGEDKATVAARIKKLFDRVKAQYSDVFDVEDRITLNDDSIAYAVAQLQSFCVIDAERDAIGDAFEAFIDYATKGPQGQFFTPRNVVKLMVQIAQVSKDDKVIDPACGTGGFIVEALKAEWDRLHEYCKELEWPEKEIASEEQKIAIRNIRGIDKDGFLCKTAKAYMALMGDGRGGIFCENSLVQPENWQEKTRSVISLNSFDLVLTNPPFGKKLKIDETETLGQYELGRKWKRNDDGVYEMTDELLDSQPPQILFVERCMNLLKKSGRMCFVAPESLFCNPSHKHIVQYIKQHGTIEAIISMPEELFQPYTHAKTCIVYVKKGKSSEDHDIFMGIARFCGHDSRGSVFPKDDIPQIQERYRQYVEQGTIPYDHLGFVIKESQIVNNIYLPKYYNPEITAELKKLSATHELISMRQLVADKVISIKTGDEVHKENYGSGPIPFVRTSDIANWEIKIDPKQGLSRTVYEKFKTKQDVRENDILMVRDGTYLVGTCGIITNNDKEIVYQSHIYKIRVNDTKKIHPYLLLALLSSPIVKKQIFAKRFTQDIIDTLGERIHELVLPIPKNKAFRNKVVADVEKVMKLKEEAKTLSRKAMLEVAALNNEDKSQQFMTLIVN